MILRAPYFPRKRIIMSRLSPRALEHIKHDILFKWAVEIETCLYETSQTTEKYYNMNTLEKRVITATTALIKRIHEK